MTENEKLRFFETWTAAWQAVGKVPGSEGMKLAFNVLARFELHDVVNAISQHLADPERGRYAVTPADIVARLEQSTTDLTAEYWPKVLQAAARYGRYRSVMFDDPAVNEAIRDIGGWAAICNSTTYDHPRTQKSFAESYARHKQRGAQHSKPLTGAFEDEPVTLVHIKLRTGTRTGKGLVA